MAYGKYLLLICYVPYNRMPYSMLGVLICEYFYCILNTQISIIFVRFILEFCFLFHHIFFFFFSGILCLSGGEKKVLFSPQLVNEMPSYIGSNINAKRHICIQRNTKKIKNSTDERIKIYVIMYQQLCFLICFICNFLFSKSKEWEKKENFIYEKYIWNKYDSIADVP